MLGLVTLMLAVFYVTKCLTQMDGPINVFVRLRFLLGATPNKWGHVQPRPGSLAYLSICPVCQAVWWSIVLASAVRFLPESFEGIKLHAIAVAVVNVLAIAGGASVLHIVLEKTDGAEHVSDD